MFYKMFAEHKRGAFQPFQLLPWREGGQGNTQQKFQDEKEFKRIHLDIKPSLLQPPTFVPLPPPPKDGPNP